MISFGRKPVIPTPKSPYSRPGKRLPRRLSSEAAFQAGYIAGLRVPTPYPSADLLNDAYHRGHSAGMYSATMLLAEQLGITL